MLIKSTEELLQLKERYLEEIKIRKTAETIADKIHIMVCAGTGCVSAESLEMIKSFKEIIKEKGYENKVTVVATGCFGFCGQGPVIKIHPDDVFYVRVKPDDIKEIVDQHIIEGNVVERLLFKDPETHKPLSKHKDMNFYKKQYRIALRNCGLINPEKITE